jgi:hypothetical protein
MRSDSGWLLVFLFGALVLGSIYLAAKWINYKLGSELQRPRLRKYEGLASIAIGIFLLVGSLVLPSRDPAFRRSRQITLLVVLAVLAPLVAVQTARQFHRNRMLPEWAKTHGFTVTSWSLTEAEKTLPEDLRRLPLYRRGSEPATRVVMERNEGKDGLQVLIFDYEWLKVDFPWWMARGWTGRHTRRVTVIAFHQLKLRLPAFELRPAEVAEQPLDDHPPWMRFELPEQPRFTAWYTLYAQDSTSLQRVFSHAVVNALDRDPDWCLEGLGEWFIAYHYHRANGFWTLRASGLDCLEPDEISTRLKTTHHLFCLMTARL